VSQLKSLLLASGFSQLSRVAQETVIDARR